MYYLDIKTPMINFQEYRNSLYVDKTLMIDKIQNRIRTFVLLDQEDLVKQ